MADSVLKINDAIHGNILISSFEKTIISTQAFNRLHNILQNSTVYLTFPSNQTKRFVHSLGVMHLGGEIFRYSIINADKEIRDQFLDQINKEIENLSTNRDFIDKLRLSLEDKNVDLINDYQKIKIEDPMYDLITPKVIEDRHIFSYILLFQSIRIVALLHDVGHPPFSHITEFALKKVWKNVDSIPKNNRTANQADFLQTTNFYSEKKDFDLHEQIGNNIAHRLTNHVIEQSKDNTPQLRLFYWLVHKFVTLILEEDGKIFEDIHRIVASSIDCDRLDYVTRDMLSSGLSHGQIEYNRLMTSMKLVKNNTDYIFSVDVKTVNTAEDFFNRRWLLYKDIIFHHRVIKTDYLLEKVITTLAEDYLSEVVDEIPNKNHDNVLPLNISGLWRAVKGANSNLMYFDSLIQWDDAWLITVLRQQYFNKYCKENTIVKYQLEELLSNKKYYTSIIKKMDSFLAIDRSFTENIELDITSLKDSLGEPFEDILNKIGKKITDYEESFGFLLNYFKELFDLWETITDEDQILEDIIRTSINEVINNDKYNFKDCLVVFKNLKTGLEKNFPYVHKDGQTELLSKYSRIDKDLNINKTVFPTFFVYVFNTQKFDDLVFRKEVGSKISEKINIFFKQLY